MLKENFVKRLFLVIILLVALKLVMLHAQNKSAIPYLKQKGTATQLMVHDNPFLILGGELGNSSTSNIEYMQSIWPKMEQLNINTVLAPVYWELIEPIEGKFDFTLVDKMISDARKHNLKLVFLWFGAWKNSMSCYAPIWVKTNTDRFPRMVDEKGKSQEILSAFSDEVLKADISAFSQLLKHIKNIDEKETTVLMIQVENEIGMLPVVRDMSVISTHLFKSNVPTTLLDYLLKNKDNINSWLKNKWLETGGKTSGTWEDVFGSGIETEEIFMAWHYSVFVNKLANSGKSEYALPMYVNAALNRPNLKPGQYPSAGPLVHLMDIWKAGAPSINFLSPDIYFPEIELWCSRYKRIDNPLFVPENQLGVFNGANAMAVIGSFDAIGYCPFSVESIEDAPNSNLAKSYNVLKQLSPLILEKQGQGLTAGVLLDSINEKTEVKLNGYTLKFRHEKNWLKPIQSIPADQQKVGCLVIAIAPDEFLIAGTGILVTFEPDSPGLPIVGFASIDEVKFVDGKMIFGRRLNGDQNHQGRHVHLPFDKFDIQKVKLYRYK